MEAVAQGNARLHVRQTVKKHVRLIAKGRQKVSVIHVANNVTNTAEIIVSIRVMIYVKRPAR